MLHKLEDIWATKSILNQPSKEIFAYTIYYDLIDNVIAK